MLSYFGFKASLACPGMLLCLPSGPPGPWQRCNSLPTVCRWGDSP